VTFGFVAHPYGALWGDVRAMLAPAMERGGNDWNALEDALAANLAQLWLATDPPMAAVTRIDGDTLELWVAGGAVIEGARHLETAVEASKAAGTTNGRIIGRKGWARVLKPWGWRPEGGELVKEWAHG